MLSSDILNPLLNSALTCKITWLEASNRFELDEFIKTFHHTRNRVQELIKNDPLALLCQRTDCERCNRVRGK